MTMGELEVLVMDGTTLVQRWPCRRTTLPNGAPGVLWRGIAYPLLPGGCIDVGVPPPAEPAPHHAVIPGDEASWVLIQGMPAALDTARRALEGNRITVSRTGRWLGDPVGQTAFDWFLRCEGKLDEQQVTNLLAHSAPVPVESDSGVRLAVLEQRVAGLLADVARAEDGLRRSMQTPPPASDRLAEPDPALQNALVEIESLRASLEAIGADHPVESRPEPQAPQTIRTRDEVAALLAVLRPDVLLIRDSWLVAFGELHSRDGFYKAVGALPLSGSRPPGWKKLHGAERWWECHVSTGRNDHGRAYAKYDTALRHWSLLIGWKVDQAQDIAWLRRQG